MAVTVTAITVTALQREPLDALVWRAIGRGPGAVETVLEANPGLAEVAGALPEGRQVLIPAPASAPQSAPMIQLWD